MEELRRIVDGKAGMMSASAYAASAADAPIVIDLHRLARSVYAILYGTCSYAGMTVLALGGVYAYYGGKS
jgi:cobyrinic acid a,c-diamide synthase